MHATEHTLKQIIPVLKKVGEYQCGAFRSPALRRDMKFQNEMVTAIDVTSEQMLKQSLLELVPEASFYGEETEQTIGEGWTWIVDPLDGTTNFIHGIDRWAVSVALAFGKEPLLGCVYDPFRNELFTAIAGIGAWQNGTPLKRIPDTDGGKALIATGFPYRSPGTRQAFLQTVDEVLPHCRGIRRMGAAASDLCYLAAGYYQGFWEVDLQPYDVAGALVLLKETGCTVTDFFGEPYNMFTSKHFVAGTKEMYALLQPITEKHYSSIYR